MRKAYERFVANALGERVQADVYGNHTVWMRLAPNNSQASGAHSGAGLEQLLVCIRDHGGVVHELIGDHLLISTAVHPDDLPEEQPFAVPSS